MTPLAAVWFLFVGSLIGFVAGIFVTLAHPVYLKHWHDYKMAKKSRRDIGLMTESLIESIAKKAEREHAAARKEGGREGGRTNS